jgi:hypothetical protein
VKFLQVVLADGRIATCTETTTVIEELDGSITTVHDGDLFWALRGGGGGTFGVVVYFVYKLHMMPSGMVTFYTWIPFKYDTFNLDISSEVLTVLNSLILSLPRVWGGYYLFDNWKVTVPVPGSASIAVTGHLVLFMNKFAPWDGSEESVFSDVISLCNKYTISYTFSNKTSFWDYEQNVTDPDIIRIYLVGTLLQPNKVGEDLVAFYKQEMFETFKDNIFMSCTGILVGGSTVLFGGVT